MQSVDYVACCFPSLFQVGKVGQEFQDEVKCMPDRVWPSSIGHQPECILPRNLWWPIGVSRSMSSEVSCIKLCHLLVDEASTRDVLYPLKVANTIIYVLVSNNMSILFFHLHPHPSPHKKKVEVLLCYF